MDGATQDLIFPHDAPEPGAAREVADGVIWIRLPLPMRLDHVNVYALADGDGWTLVDTGFHSRRGVGIWESLLSDVLGGRPVHRVVLTHHHPDHVGMAGWFKEHHGAEVVATRTAWLMARMLTLDVQEEHTREAVAFWREAGVPADVLAARTAERPFNFADVVHPIPTGYTRIRQGDQITMGGRRWATHIGNGHAPEHATFWSLDDDLVLTGDQVLPGISPNLGVYPTEPMADPVGEWLEACTRLSNLAERRHMVLPGHKLPFTGLPRRLSQLLDNHHGALDRLEAHLETPRVAAECFQPLFMRDITGGEYSLALVETVGHLNHLLATGRARRERRDDDAWVWERATTA